eukprot:1196252-Prorocentrum_minimum.AAC.1
MRSMATASCRRPMGRAPRADVSPRGSEGRVVPVRDEGAMVVVVVTVSGEAVWLGMGLGSSVLPLGLLVAEEEGGRDALVLPWREAARALGVPFKGEEPSEPTEEPEDCRLMVRRLRASLDGRLAFAAVDIPLGACAGTSGLHLVDNLPEHGVTGTD